MYKRQKLEGLQDPDLEAINLETFLGGMETVRPRRGGLLRLPLKPSLVEWKPGLFRVPFARETPLETFLGGMETKKNSAC